MCNPTLMAAALMGGQQAYNSINQSNVNALNTETANRNYLYNMQNLAIESQERRASVANTMMQSQQNATTNIANTQVNSASGGYTGLSIDSIVSAVTRQRALDDANTMQVNNNRDITENIRGDLVLEDRNSTINNLQRPKNIFDIAVGTGLKMFGNT